MKRRIRTAWLLRQRYRRLALPVAVLGGLAAAVPIWLVLADVGVAGALASPLFLLASALVVAAGALLPRWLVTVIGRRHVRWHE